MRARLSGKRVIVTGAGSGIGRVSALLFAHEGAQVLAVDRVEAAVDETAQMIRKEGGAVSSVAADVSDEAAVKGFVDHCLSEFGGLNVVYANAGGTPYSASKAGVISLVQTAANEFYGTGVRVNAICPGLIETGMTKPIFDGARARGSDDKIGRLNPLKITTWR
ncbi:MAG: SDR family NAD(P)-dependent oxidoreductase [Parvibaculum sp.]|nr:SDR family NAD(P)-dependent oxidoreductase [Parvibaculum sp.]